MKSRVSFDMSSSVSFPVSPKSTRPIRSGAEHQDVRRVRVAVEVPVAEDHRHPRLGDQVREMAPLVERPVVEVEIGELHAFETLEREHARPRVCPVDARDRDVRMAGEVLVERVGVSPLEPVVELLPDRPRELVDDVVRVDEVERADPLLGEARRLVHQREVGLDLLRRVRPLHLDDDLPAVRERRARAPDRSTPPRAAPRRTRVNSRSIGWPRSSCDHPLDIGERERPDVVLEASQLADDVGRHDVRPRREQLAELHERRAELVEHVAQVPPARACPRARDPDAARPSTR